MGISECRIINFPKVHDARGNLSIIQENSHIPFKIRRVYYLYDVPSGTSRGGHAHLETEQIIIALSGSFDVLVDDGFERKSIFLNRPHYGLYIPPLIWREIENFSSNSVALSIVSTVFDEGDYLRDYDDFRQKVKTGSWKVNHVPTGDEGSDAT